MGEHIFSSWHEYVFVSVTTHQQNVTYKCELVNIKLHAYCHMLITYTFACFCTVISINWKPFT